MDFLWLEAGKECYGNRLWIERMKENGDYNVPCRDDLGEKYFRSDLDRYTMGSDCELF